MDAEGKVAREYASGSSACKEILQEWEEKTWREITVKR